jgi:hypothetical protein
MSKVVAVSYQKHIFTYQSNINKNMEHTKEFLIGMFAAYMGCEVEYKDVDGKKIVAKLTGVSVSEGLETTYKRKRGNVSGDYLSFKPNGNHNTDALHTKPILTPLSKITDDDAVEVAKIAQCRYQAIESIIIAGRELVTIYINRQTNVSALSWCQIIDFLRSKHYDCGYLHISSLIKAGLAVKATK